MSKLNVFSEIQIQINWIFAQKSISKWVLFQCKKCNFSFKIELFGMKIQIHFWHIWGWNPKLAQKYKLVDRILSKIEEKSRHWLSTMYAKHVEEDLHYRRIGLSTCGSPSRQPLKMRHRPPGNPCCKFPSFQKPSLQ